MNTPYEHQSVEHDASISVERDTPGPGMSVVTITYGDNVRCSIDLWTETLEALIEKPDSHG